MKVSVLFVLCASALIIKENFGEKSVENKLKSDEKSSVAAAIGEILENFYSKKDQRVDILCYPCKTTKSTALFNEIPKNGKTEVAFRVVKPNEKIQINASTIMIFDSKADHDEFKFEITFEKFATNQPYHIIYYPELKQKRITFTKESKYENINYIQNLNKTYLSLSTLEHFIGKDCNEVWIKTINYFAKATRKWKKNDDFFLDKFKDFHGCELNFGKERNDNDNKAPSKGEKFGGQNYEINEAITKKLNIKSKYLMCPLNQTKNENYCPMIYPRVPEMILRTSFIIQNNNSKYIQLVFFDFEHYAGFLIPPGELNDFVSLLSSFYFFSFHRRTISSVRENVHDVRHGCLDFYRDNIWGWTRHHTNCQRL
jgi:hypothetical protein